MSKFFILRLLFDQSEFRKKSIVLISRVIFAVLLLAVSGCYKTHYQFENELEPIPPTSIRDKDVQVALVLGGGGARGMFHIGVLEVLEEAEIPIDLIVGCSAGSIVGALYADCPSIERVREVFIRCKRQDLLEFNILHCRYGLSEGRSLRRFLCRYLQARTFEELQIPFLLVTTDLECGQLLTLGSGPLIPAIHASCAVPFFFNPVKLYGRILVDGGVLDPNPVGVAREFDPKIIIAVDLTEMLPKTAPSNLFGIAQRCLEISYTKQSQLCVSAADVIIRPELEPIGMFDDKHNMHLYEAGKEATRKVLAQIQDIYADRVLSDQTAIKP